MSKVNFRCRYCRQTRALACSRIFDISFVRCDACFAVNAITESERLKLIRDAGFSGATSSASEDRAWPN
jgi:hypothetical protein